MFLNQKDSEKNNKEIKRLMPLLNNKEKQEEPVIKPEDNKLQLKLNNTKLLTSHPKKLIQTPEDK